MEAWVQHAMGRVLKHEACEEHWGLDLFLQEEGRRRGQPEAALKEMVMENKGKLALGRGPILGDGQNWPCGTQSLIGVSLVLGRSLDLRPPNSLGWTVAFCSFSFPLDEQEREDYLFADCNQQVCVCGMMLVRGEAFLFLSCCSSWCGWSYPLPGAPCTSVVCCISSPGTNPAGMEMGGWLLCCGRDVMLLFLSWSS